jgi:hypothetical protein
MDIESVETLYNNINFRSRLEARWAIFWDVLEVKYDYEPEKFDFGEIRYIPDFWLPEREKWVEIKGQMPTDEEERKAFLLAKETQQDVVVFSGLFQFQTFPCEYCKNYHYITIPSGVGITYFTGGTGTRKHMETPIDEFNFFFLGYELKKDDDLHTAFTALHQAFMKALRYKFPPPFDYDKIIPMKTYESMIEKYKGSNSE